LKHAVIFAHPRARSFTAAVADAYARAAEAAGGTVEMRDLYRIGFDPCLKAEEMPGARSFGPAPDVVAERERLADCDVFALIYPFWLNAPPAMLKGYLDRVFGFGFAYGGAGQSANPLLTGRKLISFTASGAPTQWVQETGTLEAVQTLFDRSFARQCGLTPLSHTHFGGLAPVTSQAFIQARLADVATIVTRHFGR